MGVEIERKFLVADDGWRTLARSAQRIRQGYLSTDPARSVRVRLSGNQAWVTIKGLGVDAARPEFEYAIPAADALAMLDGLCLRPQIDKTRHRVPHAGRTFEVDVFHGDNEGLIVAEVELESVAQVVELPPWIGAEVTGDPRYFNASLTANPYSRWARAGGG